MNKFGYEGHSPFEISQIEFTSQALKFEQSWWDISASA